MGELSAQVTHGLAPLPPPVLIPVPPVLHDVVPEGGLRPGTITAVEGSAALALALTAGLGERWCAVVGLPEAHLAAAMSMGGDPTRVLLVDEPGPRWADVVAALTDGCALVLTRPPDRPAPQVTRRLTALARRNGCALVVTGPWEGAHLRLHVETSRWSGLGAGTGHLRGRQALVVSSGRGAAGPGRRAWLWLPGPDGSLRPAEVAAGTRTIAVAG
ncbi:hypothetical protein [Actinomadura sp. DC4]|uniref:hypothetical protein n=1 Tax=Actinomadura sp. DC4 TaxID=3055069 RepID=UPI0025AEED43|nr:hypothetical protein [Actinomadura sp. DC4]MDN3351201.1 hypothetical protein [Actinomadura sp. DC4]